ncbi:MAG: efflux RND transporter permease subunit [Candidatus Scatomorpha sp.]|jgi:predicted RND superfamily exporter protein
MDKKSGGSFMQKVAAVIVDRKTFFFLAFIVMAIFCAFSRNWVNVNDDITSYLAEDTETRQGLDIMESEFTTFATANVMVSSITYDAAAKLVPQIEVINGVHSVEFDATEAHYKNASALFTVTFDGDTTSEVSESAMDEIKSLLADYDTYISSEVGNPMEQTIKSEMVVVLGIAVFIIIAVLLFTSKTYMEIPVLLITFGAAALLNMGTNYWFGTISYVTDSIAVVLQLALAIDYAIILCHRYTEEREHLEARDAAVAALSKAIPEISASSLTTISGLAALTLMHFRLGYDMGIVLIKAIVMSMLSVFLLMPGLLVLFSKLIDKTHHRSFVPKISLWGKLTVKTRYIIPPLFLIIAAAAFVFANRCPYVYGYSTLDTVKQNESKIADKMVASTFGTDNLVAMLVPSGSYEKEAKLLKAIEALPEVKSAMGLANIEAMDGYTVTSALTPRQFSELTDQDIEAARLLYAAYAVNEKDYGQIVSSIDDYSVPLVDIVLYLQDQKNAGYITLERDMSDMLDEMCAELEFGLAQLEGENWSRFVIYLNLPEESEETYEFLDTLHGIAGAYYDDCVLVGESVNARDLRSSFSTDNLLISILSALFVVVVLLFTFRSVGLPLLLIIVIQSSIWINFSVPYLTSSNLFFISYLIVSAIQMGANIDYAIVISSRYLDLKKSMPIKEAMIETLNQAFPTIITSGAMLASAGLIIGRMTSDNTISSIGTCLGRGTIISIFLVMGVLPQILLLGDILIEKTAFAIKKPEITHVEGSTIRLHGRVRGQISGFVDADIQGVFQGSLHAMVESGAIEVDETRAELPPGTDAEPEDDRGEDTSNED